MSVFLQAFRKQAKFFEGARSVRDTYLNAICTENNEYLRPVPENLRDPEAQAFVNACLSQLSLVSKNDHMYFCVESDNGYTKNKLLIILDDQQRAVVVTKKLEESELSAILDWCRKIIGLQCDVVLLKNNMIQSIDTERFSSQSDAGKTMILTAGPSISSREAAYSFDAAINGWNSEWSKYLTKFETEFAKYVGAKYALATSSCTGALQIALMSLDIGPGDEVIVPDQTWVSTANAVRYVGAIPIFADIELDTWNIDAASIETLVTPHTKAIIAVHMYGHPARMTNILNVAKKHKLKVVEDAAPAIGAEWRGQRCGSFGDFAAFSFQGAKLLVTGEGGMLVTNDDALYEKAKKIWDQGRNPSKVFWIDADGVKFKMSNIQAALGLGQLERADELIEMKRRLFNWYEEGLSGVPHITLNKEVEGARSIYWMSSLFLDEASPISRDDLMNQLKLRNIDTRPVFPAISQYPIWPRKSIPQPNAMRVGLRAMNMPSGVCLTKDEVMYVCRNIAELVK